MMELSSIHMKILDKGFNDNIYEEYDNGPDDYASWSCGDRVASYQSVYHGITIYVWKEKERNTFELYTDHERFELQPLSYISISDEEHTIFVSAVKANEYSSSLTFSITDEPSNGHC